MVHGVGIWSVSAEWFLFSGGGACGEKILHDGSPASEWIYCKRDNDCVGYEEVSYDLISMD